MVLVSKVLLQISVILILQNHAESKAARPHEIAINYLFRSWCIWDVGHPNHQFAPACRPFVSITVNSFDEEVVKYTHHLNFWIVLQRREKIFGLFCEDG